MVGQSIGTEKAIRRRLPKARHWAIHLQLGEFWNPIARKALPEGVPPGSFFQPGKKQVIVHERVSFQNRPEADNSKDDQSKSRSWPVRRKWPQTEVILWNHFASAKIKNV